MALNMDDKILGEKVQCYISDDSDNEDEELGGLSRVGLQNQATMQNTPGKAQTGYVHFISSLVN
jgi:hypothetical protein